ncbi:MAG: WYL domain-containing transcriptional regulator [Dehalococcoidia bacterium]
MRENKRDRLARLSKVEHILYQCPEGLTVGAIAEKCGVCARTARRDLEALESIGVPVWEDGARRGIEPGYFLPPISFTLPEAMTIFLAARLMLAYSNTYNPNIDSTFVKLNSAVPAPLRDQVRRTIDWMQKLQRDDRLRRIMDALTHAWINGRRVKMTYQALGRPQAGQRVIEPYFIQPATFEHANYLIAYCHQARRVRTFKIDRIIDIALLDEHYSIPADFDANKFLAPAWGITLNGSPVKVRLRFDPEIARIAAETRWHPSQSVKMQQDGSAEVGFMVPVSDEFVSFVLRWGDKVEALQPAALRKKVADAARRMMRMYETTMSADRKLL